VKVKKKMPPAWKISTGTSMIANSENVNPKSSESLGTSKSPSPYRSSISQDPADSGLKPQVVTEVEFKVGPESQNQLRDPTTGTLQACQTNMLPTTDSLPAQASLSSYQRMSNSKMANFNGPCNFLMRGGHSQAQKNPGVTRVKVPGRNYMNMFGNPDESENCGSSIPGQQEERLAGVRPVSAPVTVRKIGTVGNKSFPCPPKKGQAPPESHMKTKMKHFLNPHTTGKGQEDALPKVKHPSTINQSQGSVTSRHFKDSGAAEAQALTSVVGQILVAKLGLQHGNGPSEIHCHEDEAQALLGKHHSPRGPSNQEPSQVLRQMCSGQQDSHKGQSPYQEQVDQRQGQKSIHAVQEVWGPSQSLSIGQV
jgi:hypothetical protein